MFGADLPIVVAPMGGVTTPELVAATCNAGALGSLAAAYLSPPMIAQAIARVRELTDRPFAVNLFVTPDPEPLDRDPSVALAVLGGYHRELGLPPVSLPDRPAEQFAEQAAVVLAERVPVFTFTFGIPSADWLDRFRADGTKLIGTATTAHEAVLLADAGVDAISAQGADAGAHRGTFAHAFEDAMVPMATLVRECLRAVRLPVIAAGGIMDGRDVRAALDTGAAAAQLGTAFVPCPESAAAPAYKAALLAARDGGASETTVTRAFSGRPAKGLRNRFIAEVEAQPQAILPYPWQNAATRPMRTAAGKQGRAEFLSLWAGDGVARCRQMPAADLVRLIAREAGLTQVKTSR